MTREEKWTEWEVERKGDRLMEMRSGDLRDGGVVRCFCLTLVTILSTLNNRFYEDEDRFKQVAHLQKPAGSVINK